jgi:ubiquinone/menaquinone biosynthesis C-methylase UbiE
MSKPMGGLVDADLFERNFRFYNSAAAVADYSTCSILQPAENAIFEILRPHLTQMRMLDLGVGGGRTTGHFAPLVSSYVGVDYSTAMISRCREKFPTLHFVVANASDLSLFSNGSFDFILFSYNGIDYLNFKGRHRVFCEIRRLLSDGGYFCFSSHNLRFFSRLAASFRPVISFNPRKTAGAFKHFIRFYAKNKAPWQVLRSDTAIVFEGNQNFACPTFYIRPEYQFKILNALGMNEIRLFPNEYGKELVDHRLLPSRDDPWIYYLCRSLSSSLGTSA